MDGSLRTKTLVSGNQPPQPLTMRPILAPLLRTRRITLEVALHGASHFADRARCIGALVRFPVLPCNGGLFRPAIPGGAAGRSVSARAPLVNRADRRPRSDCGRSDYAGSLGDRVHTGVASRVA